MSSYTWIWLVAEFLVGNVWHGMAESEFLSIHNGLLKNPAREAVYTPPAPKVFMSRRPSFWSGNGNANTVYHLDGMWRSSEADGDAAEHPIRTSDLDNLFALLIAMKFCWLLLARNDFEELSILFLLLYELMMRFYGKIENK